MSHIVFMRTIIFELINDYDDVICLSVCDAVHYG